MYGNKPPVRRAGIGGPSAGRHQRHKRSSKGLRLLTQSRPKQYHILSSTQRRGRCSANASGRPAARRLHPGCLLAGPALMRPFSPTTCSLSSKPLSKKHAAPSLVPHPCGLPTFPDPAPAFAVFCCWSEWGDPRRPSLHTPTACRRTTRTGWPTLPPRPAPRQSAPPSGTPNFKLSKLRNQSPHTPARPNRALHHSSAR